MTEPQRLADLLADALDHLAERTATARVDARCQARHPISDTPCPRPEGHSGGNTPDGEPSWTETQEER